MAEAEKKQATETKTEVRPVKAIGMRKGPRGRRPSFRRGGKRSDKPADEFEQRIVDLARVTRVMAGGKRMKFRATMVIGDKKGRVAIGVAKGADVAMAIAKAVTQAKKHLIEVPIVGGTVPHQVTLKEKSAKIMIRPARKGSGIKAGGVVRIVLELAGIKDVVAKILGTNNKVNNAKTTINILQSFVPQAVDMAKSAKETTSYPQDKSDNNSANKKATEKNKPEIKK